MGKGLNRKRMKKKLRSCGLCKPHKVGGTNRWKVKEHAQMQADNLEIKKGGDLN